MGNSTSNIFSSNAEYITGVKLLSAIKANSPTLLQSAFEQARTEIVKDHNSSFTRANELVAQYLTQKYDYGEGMFNKKNPIEYCELLGANEALVELVKLLITVSRSEEARNVINNNNIDMDKYRKLVPDNYNEMRKILFENENANQNKSEGFNLFKSSSTTSTVTQDANRVNQAKERLKEFQKTRGK